jgi:hypothetical protein
MLQQTLDHLAARKPGSFVQEHTMFISMMRQTQIGVKPHLHHVTQERETRLGLAFGTKAHSFENMATHWQSDGEDLGLHALEGK